MSERLREAMRTLGDEAAPARVDERTWARARRARTRERAVSAVVVLGLVAVAGWAGVQLVGDPEPPVVDSEMLGLPDEVFMPPDHIDVLEEGDPFEPVALVLGGAARQSWWSGSTSLVAAVVGAETGSYRLLDLPELAAPASTGEVSLSNDGTLLAWTEQGVAHTWSVTSGDVSRVPMPSGVAVSSAPEVSPDGSQVALQTERSLGTRIVVVDLASGEATLLPRFCPYLLGWSPSGDAVLCEGPKSVLAVDAAGNRNQRLLPLSTATPPLQVSPGGRYVLDIGDGNPRVTDLRARETARFPERGLDSGAGVFFNPVRGWVNRKTAVVADRRTGLVTLDVTSGVVERLVALPQEAEVAGSDLAPVVVAQDVIVRRPYEAEEPDWGSGLPWSWSWLPVAVPVGLLLLVVLGRAFIAWRWPDPPEADTRDIHMQHGGG